MCGLKKIISMFILLTLSITQVSAVNIPIERLNVSKDYASVQTAGTDNYCLSKSILTDYPQPKFQIECVKPPAYFLPPQAYRAL